MEDGSQAVEEETNDQTKIPDENESSPETDPLKEKHPCLYKGCPLPACEGKMACDFHGCIKSNCVNPSVFRYDYCPEHKCLISDCPSINRYNSSYCTLHTCSETVCSNYNEHLKTCRQHRCFHKGCHNVRKSGIDQSMFCSIHTCSGYLCFHEATKASYPSQLCEHHYNEQHYIANVTYMIVTDSFYSIGVGLLAGLLIYVSLN